jgi:hypothetical protein
VSGASRSVASVVVGPAQPGLRLCNAPTVFTLAGSAWADVPALARCSAHHAIIIFQVAGSSIWISRQYPKSRVSLPASEISVSSRRASVRAAAIEISAIGSPSSVVSTIRHCPLGVRRRDTRISPARCPLRAVVAIVTSARGIAPLKRSSSRSVVVELIGSPPYGCPTLPFCAAGTHVRNATHAGTRGATALYAVADRAGEPLGLRLRRIALRLTQAPARSGAPGRESVVADDLDGRQVRLDPVYFDSPYYLYPDGPIAVETLRVIGAAMAEAGVVGLGRLTLSRRERMVMVEPRGTGIALFTLRAAPEVRAPQFGSVVGDLDAEMVAIAGAIIRQRTGNFDPSTYRDRYQEALQQLIEAKMKGLTIKPRAMSTPSPVIDLMAALKRSLAQEPSVQEQKTAKKKRTRQAPNRRQPALLLPLTGDRRRNRRPSAERDPTDLSSPCAPEALSVSWRRVSVCELACYPLYPWPPSSRAMPPSGRRH